MNQVDVSVIIPFYRGAGWLAEAVKSVEAQTVHPREVIIVNDGSEEKLPDFDNSKLNIVIFHQENRGAACARNHGIRKAVGKYVAFLDADDIWHPRKLELQYSAMEKVGAQWSITSYSMFKDGNNGFVMDEVKETEEIEVNLFPAILCTCQIATPTVMIKRELMMQQQAWFNETLKYGEDTCLWFWLANYAQVVWIKGNLANIRFHGNNAASQIGVQLLARKDLWEFFCSLDVCKQNQAPKIVVFTYKLCIWNGRIASAIFGEKKVRTSKVIGTLFYALPWLLFRLLGAKLNAYMP